MSLRHYAVVMLFRYIANKALICSLMSLRSCPYVACRTGVFQGNRGEGEASARRARVACEGRFAKIFFSEPPHACNSRFALASLSPLFPWNMQKITPVLQVLMLLLCHYVRMVHTAFITTERSPRVVTLLA